MKFYWRMDSIPELAGLPKAEQRRRWRRAYFRSFRSRRLWLAFAGLLAMNLTVTLLVVRATRGLTDNPLLLGAAALVVLVGATAFSQAIIWAVRPELARERAAEAPDPADDDGSYWVPPAR
ncbi:MAG TPA: hypothetical protein VGE07_12300 [Herpetosiphonaceae bacterium]